MLKFLKTTVEEEEITTEEILEVVEADSVVVEVQLQEEKEVLLQEEKDLADLEATEDLLLEKADSDQEAHLLQEQVVFHLIEHQDLKVLLIEHLDVLKALVMHQGQEDQEETKEDCRLHKVDCKF
jgi:hypothetical protein